MAIVQSFYSANPPAASPLLTMRNAVHLFGDRSRLGYSSARPRAEQSGSHPHQTVRPFHTSQSAARARLIAPEAGALTISTAWIRPGQTFPFIPHRVSEKSGSQCNALFFWIAMERSSWKKITCTGSKKLNFSRTLSLL
jgi:hypothetical protein